MTRPTKTLAGLRRRLAVAAGRLRTALSIRDQATRAAGMPPDTRDDWQRLGRMRQALAELDGFLEDRTEERAAAVLEKVDEALARW